LKVASEERFHEVSFEAPSHLQISNADFERLIIEFPVSRFSKTVRKIASETDQVEET
jgi:hypothetical protein